MTKLPGRYIDDKDRHPFGLGWEYARRGWDVGQCPYRNAQDASTFVDGFDAFKKPSNRSANEAMLKGIK